MKEKSIGDPGQYLGGKLCQVKLKKAFISTQYFYDAVNNVEHYLKNKNDKLVAKAPAYFKSGYCLEIDITEDL